MNKALNPSSLLLVALFWAVPSTAQAPAPAADWDARAKAALSMSDGKLKVDGLRQPVRVARDRWGVAHIYAQNQHDLFFAQGRSSRHSPTASTPLFATENGREDKGFQSNFWQQGSSLNRGSLRIA
jgi:hypothetical protein